MSEKQGLRVSVLVGRRDFDLEIDLHLEPGARLALVGPSGAGKTTILKAVAGLARPVSGRIEVAGQTVFDSGERIDVPPEERRCGYVPQDYSLFPNMTALANVGYGIRNANGGERRSRAGRLLEQLGISELADVRPPDLSGGEKQRVALARALATEPALFLLDEPLSALDPATREQAIPVLQHALDIARVPTLIVTHSRHEAERLADSSLIIDRGRATEAREHDPGGNWNRRAGSVSIHRVVRKQRD